MLFNIFFDTYGEVTPETFQAKENEVESITYDPNTPIDNLYKEIEDLIDLSGRAHVPMTAAQAISIGYIILWKTSVLKEALRQWNALPDADKNWNRFKTHFRNEIKTYKQLRGPTMQDSIFQQHNANLLRDIKTELKSVIEEEIARHTANFATFHPPLPPAPPSFPEPYSYASPFQTDPAMQQQMHQMANAISEYKDLVPSLVNQVKQLQTVIKQLKQDNRYRHLHPTFLLILLLSLQQQLLLIQPRTKILSSTIHSTITAIPMDYVHIMDTSAKNQLKVIRRKQLISIV